MVRIIQKHDDDAFVSNFFIFNITSTVVSISSHCSHWQLANVKLTFLVLENGRGETMRGCFNSVIAGLVVEGSEDKVEELIEFLFKGSVVLVRFVYPESPLPVFHESMLPVVSNPIFTFLEFIPLLNSLFITWFPFLIGANPI